MTLLSWPRLWHVDHVFESLRNRPYFEFGRRPDLGACERIQARKYLWMRWNDMIASVTERICRIIRPVSAWKSIVLSFNTNCNLIATGGGKMSFKSLKAAFTSSPMDTIFLALLARRWGCRWTFGEHNQSLWLRALRIWKYVPRSCFRWKGICYIHIYIYMYEHLKDFEALHKRLNEDACSLFTTSEWFKWRVSRWSAHQEGSITYREWVPNAKQVFLIGEFNKWENLTPLSSEGFGRWAVELKDSDGKMAIPHKCQVKVSLLMNAELRSYVCLTFLWHFWNIKQHLVFFMCTGLHLEISTVWLLRPIVRSR